MKKILFGLALLASTTVFGREPILLRDLMKDYGNGSWAILVGKNIANNEPCYLNLNLGGFYSLSSIDSSGMTQDEGITTFSEKSIKINKPNFVKIFYQEVTPYFLGDTAEANIKLLGNVLKADIRNVTRLQCEFNLEDNRDLPPIPEGCVDEQISETVGSCDFVENLGSPNTSVTNGGFELQKVTAKMCVPGGVFSNFAGYVTKNPDIQYVSRNTGIMFSWSHIDLPPYGIKRNNENLFSQKIKRSAAGPVITDYTYYKKSKIFDLRYSEPEGIFSRDTLAARFKCEEVN